MRRWSLRCSVRYRADQLQIRYTGGVYPSKGKTAFCQRRENGQTRILLDTKCLEHSIEGTVYSSVQALDETAAAAITTGRSLYYVTADEVKLIAENVTLYHIAASGKAVAYVDADNNLNLYRAATGETEKLAENAEGYLAISPDGETVLYDVFHDDGYYELYMYHGGSTSLVEENLFTLAVSDKASYIYAYDAEGTLYVLAGDEKKYWEKRLRHPYNITLYLITTFHRLYIMHPAVFICRATAAKVRNLRTMRYMLCP